MKSTTKLSSEERRAAILQAVRSVFAEKGFDGTTTRELAEAAGISEALLFKHFPNKEALFSAMLHSCCTEQDMMHMERLNALEPSAMTLILVVHFLVSRIVGRDGSHDEAAIQKHRLILRSLAEDGEFARALISHLGADWIPKIEECVKAAVASGEAVEGPVRPSMGGWFIYHVAASIMQHFLPPTPTMDYGVPRDKLVEQVVWFSLRGMGLKEETIRRYYKPKALALFEN